MSQETEIMLVKVDSTANSNKFYHLVLEGDKVTARYGRVGVPGVSKVYMGGSVKYESIKRSKMRSGYREVEVVSASTSKVDLHKAASTSLTRGTVADKKIAALIDNLVAANRHEILTASGGMINIDTNGVIKTPLGVISGRSIEKAEDILANIEPGKATIKQVEEYLSLIPQPVRSQRGWHEEIFRNNAEIRRHREFLKQLKDSYNWAEAQAKAASSNEDFRAMYEDLFRFTIDTVTDTKLFNQINEMYTSSANSTHASKGLKLHRVYCLKDETSQNDYDSRLAEIGNEKQLWHGTRAFNVLSVLRKGLFVPPVRGSSFVTTGRMFGDGIYFSDQSTKALNYAYGYAPGMIKTSDQLGNSFFMFLANVAMGWEFQPNKLGYGTQFTQAALQQAHNGTDPKIGKRYNSISVKGGTCGVLNNEMIVWDTKQINLKYLCEFKK